MNNLVDQAASLIITIGLDKFVCYPYEDLTPPDNPLWAIQWIKKTATSTQILWYRDKQCIHKIDNGSGVVNTLTSYTADTSSWVTKV